MTRAMENCNLARARASCSRCHRRKKRCDRALPCCRNCNSANVRCSFQDEKGQNASYPIAYVRGLEQRLRELGANPDSDAVIPDAGEHMPAPEPEAYTLPVVAQNSPTFAQELKTLSFEATAERHLGSTSGLSFAKLTQKVLRRLTPDKADFVFAINQEDTAGASIFNFNSPSELFNDSMYQGLSETISVHPLLFGDLFLSDITDLAAAAGDMDVAWPADDAHAQHLIDFYFAHSHTLYPFLVRSEVQATMQAVRDGSAPPLDSFRLWMVLAIGSTTYSSVSLTEESESMVFYNKALQYSDQALEHDEMSALEALMLHVSYSFFNQLGPNTWFLVGTAARLALGLGLNTASAYEGLAFDMQQRRKRIFFSIYMMDRVVSIALGRPFAIHDDDVDIEPFEDVDDELCTTSRPLHPTSTAVPLHILRLRQLASRISREVYSSKRTRSTTTDGRAIITQLHQDLLEWRRGMPFPLPDADAAAEPVPVPHLHTLWYDFNYYTHLAMIYRPSPLFATVEPDMLKTLGMAASMSLRKAFDMHAQRRFAYNWLNFLAIFTSTLSLVYAVTARPDELPVVLRETRAVEDLELGMQLFETFGIKFAAARNIQGMIAEIARQYREIRARDAAIHPTFQGDAANESSAIAHPALQAHEI